MMKVLPLSGLSAGPNLTQPRLEQWTQTEGWAKSPYFCYKCAFFRSSKMFGFDFHIFIGPMIIGHLRLLKHVSVEDKVGASKL